MKLHNKKVLITGADGFIGSHLTEKLLRNAGSVRALVQYNSFNRWGWLDTFPKETLSEIEVITGDVRDPHGMRNAVNDCDVVLHLAALIAIPYSYHSPAAYVDTNVHGTLNLLQASRDLEIEKFVQTSTSEVYGTAQFVPMTEAHPLVGQSPYSATKIAADQMAEAFYRSFDMPVAIIRPFNTFGPRQSLRAVIPTLISQMASEKKEIRMGATDPTRDFNFVEDIADAFIAVAEADAAVGQTLNAGSGYEISIGDLATLLSELMDVEISYKQEADRLRPQKSEVFRLCADNSRIRSITGWSPTFSGPEGLKKGLRKTIDWYSAPMNLARFKTDIYNI